MSNAIGKSNGSTVTVLDDETLERKRTAWAHESETGLGEKELYGMIFSGGTYVRGNSMRSGVGSPGRSNIAVAPQESSRDGLSHPIVKLPNGDTHHVKNHF